MQRSPGGRIASLDVMRGAIVATMMLVNFSMITAFLDHFPIYPTLAHAEWIGFTLADFVFPAFLFMVGVSIALSLENSGGCECAALARIATRSARLFIVGFFLSNFLYQWMHDWSFDGGFRVMGVLQRISIAYFVTALLFQTLRPRTLTGLALAILLLYWPLVHIPISGELSDLHVAGANFVSWFDRAVLGPHVFVEGPRAYDPEGLLSTFPAIAQCLLGAVTGETLMVEGFSQRAVIRLWWIGLLLALAGVLWGLWLPIIKDLWTSSFVLLSTGIAMMWLAMLQVLIARAWIGRAMIAFFSVFGSNAIVAYVVHFLVFPLLTLPVLVALQRWLAEGVSAPLASLLTAVSCVLLLWAPLAVLYRRRWIVRI